MSHIRGADHCRWEGAEFITVGSPFGSSMDTPAAGELRDRFIWDPDGVLPNGPYGTNIETEDLPTTAYDTDFSRHDDTGTRQRLFFDDTEPTALYLVSGQQAQVWESDPSLGLCE